MTVFAGEIGFMGHHPYQEEEYFPALAMLDTAELFDRIPKQGPWHLPKPYSHWDTISPDSYREKWDGLLTEWIHYLDHTTTGFQIKHRAATEHIISGDLQSLQAANYFKRSGLEAKTFEENIVNVKSARRAFIALLSKDARKKLKLKPEDARASDEDIQKARTLVSNFERTS